MERVSKLQQEIQQNKPFRTLGQEAYLSILRTADVLRRQTAAILTPFGITQQQYNVLRILRGAGSEGLPTLHIGERLIEETPGITRMLDRLEVRQWVRRERCEGDRRQVLAFITPAGLELLRQLDPLVESPASNPFLGLPDSEIVRLIQLLDVVRARAGR